MYLFDMVNCFRKKICKMWGLMRVLILFYRSKYRLYRWVWEDVFFVGVRGGLVWDCWVFDEMGM